MRRLVSDIEDQFADETTSDSKETEYEIKYRNGIVETTPFIDDVLNGENIGSSKIVRLRITTFADYNYNGNNRKITVTLTDADADDESWTSTALSIDSDDRNWAFVASSAIDERLRRYSRWPWSYWTRSREATRLAFPLFLLVMLSSVMFGLVSSINDAKDEIEAALLLPPPETLSDIGDLIIEMQRIDSTSGDLNIIRMIAPLIAVTVLFFGVLVVPVISPGYVFAWGDRVDQVRTRRRIRSVVLGVIV